MGIMGIFINSTSVDVPFAKQSVAGIRHGIEIPSAGYAPCQVKPKCVEQNAHSNTLYTNNGNLFSQALSIIGSSKIDIAYQHRLQYGSRNLKMAKESTTKDLIGFTKHGHVL